jgi:hypothetical protein
MVQLIHAANDQHLWAETSDGVISDILALQSKVAHDVAAGVQGQPSRDEEVLLAASCPVHPEANTLYLKGGSPSET